MRYACIARHRGEYPVRLMCRVLTVAPSGFYTWLTRAPTARAIAAYESHHPELTPAAA